MATTKNLRSYDIAFVAHLVLGIEFALGGFIDLGGYSELVSYFAAIFSLYVFIPTIVFVIPTAIALSLFLRDGRLIFLTLLLFFTVKVLFSEPERNSTLLISAPYALASLWSFFEWFSKRRNTYLTT
jgi:hypothetical protein